MVYINKILFKKNIISFVKKEYNLIKTQKVFIMKP